MRHQICKPVVVYISKVVPKYTGLGEIVYNVSSEVGNSYTLFRIRGAGGIKMSKFWLKARTLVYLILYIVALFLLFDFAYSSFLYERGPSPRIRVPQFSHGLAPNFDGFDSFANHRYRFFTNNLGFRDSRVRRVALNSETRRVLLIGDSFTEGVGTTFEQSFAGRLYLAGQAQPEQIEFLNAGVISYSPILYYRKIEWLLGCGLEFDEVILFSDLSDVNDEAMYYFDLDADRNHAIDCELTGRGPRRRPNAIFSVTKRTIGMVKHRYRQITGQSREFHFRKNQRPAWTIPDLVVGHSYAPLGIEGGIAGRPATANRPGKAARYTRCTRAGAAIKGGEHCPRNTS